MCVFVLTSFWLNCKLNKDTKKVGWGYISERSYPIWMTCIIYVIRPTTPALGFDDQMVPGDKSHETQIHLFHHNWAISAIQGHYKIASQGSLQNTGRGQRERNRSLCYTGEFTKMVREMSSLLFVCRGIDSVYGVTKSWDLQHLQPNCKRHVHVQYLHTLTSNYSFIDKMLQGKLKLVHLC